jgi:lipopolysaccharide transport system ATP-binding protein
MGDVVVRVDGLGKQYRVGHQPRYNALRDVLTDGLLHPARSVAARFRAPASPRREVPDLLWALKDVSFEVKRGEVLGIIGRNGAGKSTLLKLLSRITEPTEGGVDLYGRVGSLLEVGTGFNPELSGRENIYLNGAILGMRHAEINRKFDEIVSFAEVERFLDMPVKRYSSGMYMRLAFSVAAHLDPEILLVDEVLAVGDVEFQKKCLGKMREVGKQGRTVLFVSHQLGAVRTLCDRGIVLSGGHVAVDQPVEKAITAYLHESVSQEGFERSLQSNGKPTITRGNVQVTESHVRIDLKIESRISARVYLHVRLTDGAGITAGFGSVGAFDPRYPVELAPGANPVSFEFPVGYFANGTYFASLDIELPDVEFYDRLESCFAFEVVREPQAGFTRALAQSWGWGNVELQVQRILADAA